MLQELNGMKILIGTVNIGCPAISPSIIQIKHSVYIVHTKPIRMEYFQPEAGIGNQKILYHRTVIIVKHGFPYIG